MQNTKLTNVKRFQLFLSAILFVQYVSCVLIFTKIDDNCRKMPNMKHQNIKTSNVKCQKIKTPHIKYQTPNIKHQHQIPNTKH